MSLQAYKTAAARAESPREMEYRLFGQVTRALVHASTVDRSDVQTRIDALDWNRRLWSALATDCSDPDNALALNALGLLTADQGGDLAAAEEFVARALRADALSDGRYPMATAISRPLIAKTLVEIARIEGASIVGHGSAGRDRGRIDQPVRTLERSLQVVACADAMTPAHVAEMVITSALLPPLAVFWRLAGAVRYRVRFA